MKAVLMKKVSQFEGTSDKGLRGLLMLEIKAIIEETERQDATELYVLGYVKYMVAEDYYDICGAHELFLQSLSKDSEYLMARLYSGHCYHDKAFRYHIKKDYHAALQEYQLVDLDQLKEQFDIWRVVKLQEQIGHCLYKTGQQAKAMAYFEVVLEYYKELSFEELPDPTEVYNCLKLGDYVFDALKALEADYYNKK